MRINKFVAKATGKSRREADDLVKNGRIQINSSIAQFGNNVSVNDSILLDENILTLPKNRYIAFNKPAGYTSSRRSQGGDSTIYDLLPHDINELKPIGRLDKYSSGMMLLSNDGDFAQKMTHPKHQKQKTYQVILQQPLSSVLQNEIENGVELDDGVSRLALEGSGTEWLVKMHEGRNRQIRRTFAAVGNKVIALHRIKFGPYDLEKLQLESGEWKEVEKLGD